MSFVLPQQAEKQSLGPSRRRRAGHHPLATEMSQALTSRGGMTAGRPAGSSPLPKKIAHELFIKSGHAESLAVQPPAEFLHQAQLGPPGRLRVAALSQRSGKGGQIGGEGARWLKSRGKWMRTE